MCKDCGCEEANKRVHRLISTDAHGHDHPHSHGDGHTHANSRILEPTKVSFKSLQITVPDKEAVTPATATASTARTHGHTLTIEQRVLAKNDQLAAANRTWFDRHHMKALNLISSPGAGKTYLLEKSLERLSSQKKITILTGDLEKDYDARRLTGKGGQVKQINTVSSCHLDAEMISRELGSFVSPDTELLIIENVGNLVCPAAFDLGEHEKVALLSTTEGEDKPSKYPLLFHTASLIVVTKVDLIPHLDWSMEKCIEHIRKVNPNAPILKVSAKTGEGMDAWIDYLGLS